MNLSTFRSTKSVLAAASVAVAALALSGCQSSASQGGAVKPNVPTTSSASGTASASPTTGSPSATDSGAPLTPPPTAAKPSPSKSATKPNTPATPTQKPGGGTPVDCTPAMLSASISPVTNPVNHVLLTATNTGSVTCNVYYYPLLRFTQDQQAVTDPYLESKPQAVVTIAPGQSAYAGITTSSADGAGRNGQVEKSVQVSLSNRANAGSIGNEFKVGMPANTYVDDAAHVTYWESDPMDAIAW